MTVEPLLIDSAAKLREAVALVFVSAATVAAYDAGAWRPSRSFHFSRLLFQTVRYGRACVASP